MVHTYEATYTIGRWATDHAPVVIFHDTQYIWPQVKQAILQIAEETGRDFYNSLRAVQRLGDTVLNIERALTIDGFMLESELQYIAECAAKSKCIAEIGCYQGRSGRAWADNTKGVLFCVDIWRDGGEANFDQNLADCHNVVKIKIDSRRAAIALRNSWADI